MNEIKIIDNWLDTAQLVCTKTGGKTKYDFNKFTSLSKFTLRNYHHDLALQEAEDDQQELKILINNLNNNFNPKNPIKTKKRRCIKVCKTSLSARESIINPFEKAIFPCKDGFKVGKESDEESDKQTDITDMPDLETEECAAEKTNQQIQGLKVLTTNQMLRRLPIALAQLKAGNNSEKLKNQVRQIFYSLYRSKKLTKQLYKCLVDII